MLLIVTQTFAPATGGMEAYMTALAEHLAQTNHQIIVFADPAPTKKHAPQFHPTTYTLRRFGGARPWRRWRKSKAIAALLKSGKVKGIFCDSWKSVEALPNHTKAPVITIAHGAEFPPNPPPAKRQRIAAALARSHRIIANSRFTAEAASAYLSPADATRITIINPPVDPPPPASPQALTNLGAKIGHRSPLLATLARLEPRKGIDRVIAALPTLRQNHPDILFLIGGDGDDKPRLQDLAQQLGIADHVAFLGRLDSDQKSALLTCADLFAMPVRREGTSVEGFGISYIEAAFFAKPALGGTDGGAADAILHEQTGLLCDGNDQPAITAALARLLADPTLRQSLGQAAQQRAQNQLTWPTALPKFLGALKLR